MSAALLPWQEEDWSRLQSLRQRLPHALLLKSPRGIGEFQLARAFARSLLCESPVGPGLACGNCASCHWFEQGTHPDFRQVVPEAEEGGPAESQEEKTDSGRKKAISKVIKVEQLRVLETFCSLSSHRGGLRIVLISPAETMHGSAANALLKTLEEPTPGLHFILLTHKPQQLLPTILSRCLGMSLVTPTPAQGQSWLESQGVEQAELLLAQSNFAPLLAMSQAEDGMADARRVLLEALSRPGSLDGSLLADRMKGVDLLQFVHWLQLWCYDLMSACMAGGAVRFHVSLAHGLRELAAGLSAVKLMQFQRDLLQAKREAQASPNARLFMEVWLLRYRQLVVR